MGTSAPTKIMLLRRVSRADHIRPYSYLITPNSYLITPNSYLITPNSYLITPNS